MLQNTVIVFRIGLYFGREGGARDHICYNTTNMNQREMGAGWGGGGVKTLTYPLLHPVSPRS